MKKSSTLILAGLMACLHVFSSPDSPTGLTLIKSNLNLANTDGTATLLDGDLTQYDPSYSNVVDGNDARKMSNFAENIGMERANVCLAIERRHTISGTDTIFYKTWNLSSARNYQLEFDASNLIQPGLSGYVEDLYLNTKTPISLDGSAFLNFSITSDPASSAVYRFRLIFTTAVGGTLPLTFTGLKAYQHNSAVNVDWNTANENNMEDYTVERSADGKNFNAISTAKAGNLPIDNYSYVDAMPATGVNYYRIMSTDINAVTRYSEILKVDIEKSFSLMKVFPNPVVNKTINLQFVNQAAGQYEIKLLSSFGQLLFTKQVQHPGGSSTITIEPSQNIPNGIYQLQITQSGGTKTSISVVY
jgi:Secretion system C-terminal sorting domain